MRAAKTSCSDKDIHEKDVSHSLSSRHISHRVSFLIIARRPLRAVVTIFVPGLWGARARGVPLPATLWCPPHACALLWALPVLYSWPLCAPTRPTTRSSACSYSPATPTRFVLLLVQLLAPRRAPTRRLPLPALCSYPFAIRARPMPVPSHFPCPPHARARWVLVPLRACAPTRPIYSPPCSPDTSPQANKPT